MLVAQSCLTLCKPMDCRLPGSSVHGILLARVLEWAAIPFSRGSSWPRELNPCLLCLLHWQACSLSLVPPGKLNHIPLQEISPRLLENKEFCLLSQWNACWSASSTCCFHSNFPNFHLPAAPTRPPSPGSLHLSDSLALFCLMFPFLMTTVLHSSL